MRKFGLLAAALLAGSCSPAGPDIRAKMVDGAVVFEAFEPGMWPFASRDPIKPVTDRFAVYGRDGAVWLIERDPGPQCRGDRASIFPLKYGQLPRCFVARVAPGPLVPGTLYRVETGYDIHGTGIIRVALSVENPDWRKLDNSAFEWPGETNPGSTHPPFGTKPSDDPQNSIIVSDADENVSSGNLAIETPPE